MDCLPKAAGALTDQIDGAKAVADGLIGDATTSVADLIKAETDSIKGKLDELVPEIELPQANLQDDMSELLSSTGDPSKLASKFKEMKDKFVGVDLDSILDGVGLDAAAFQSMDAKLSAGLDEINALADKAGGKLDAAINSLVGGVPTLSKPGFSVGKISETICKDIPNIDLDKAGNIIKKGIPAELPTTDALKIEAAAKLKDVESIKPDATITVDLTKNVSIKISKVGT